MSEKARLTECNTNNGGKRNEMEVEIISRDHIRPTSPTPHHLKTYEVSIFGILSFHFYNSFVYFYEDDSSSFSDRSQVLTQSLSETLSRFYPFSGNVQDERRIDCNDVGAYYVEAGVKDRSLSDFLGKPENNLIHKLLPFNPNSSEMSSRTYATMIQVTTFSCGGFAIALCTSHKLADLYSHKTFLKAWAEASRCSSSTREIIRPDFTSPSIFPPIFPKAVEEGAAFTPFVSNENRPMTKRFLFLGPSLMALRNRAGEGSMSRVMAVTGLVWKCAMAAIGKRSGGRCYNLMIPVNIRNRGTLPMPPYSIGTLTWLPVAQFKATEKDVPGLDSIVEILNKAVRNVDRDFVDSIKGEGGNPIIWQNLNQLKRFHSDENAEYMFMSSLCNFGTYEVDFGWGNPVWAALGDADADTSFLSNGTILMDTRSGDGIEAWVSLGEVDMAAFENDPELLAFASVNPNPL